ncbi:thioredoxin family protein [Candidatus Haliotispira prima]|uniref:Thioredoxin family protein n=1 Tax=Candidatus Haliotispira prima TaxID=3034016 RepID=A0ABY8MFW6_9SPIO|nr:thioredoxin family protein [Candidatus Haliotispira prima]
MSWPHLGAQDTQEKPAEGVGQQVAEPDRIRLWPDGPASAVPQVSAVWQVSEGRPAGLFLITSITIPEGYHLNRDLLAIRSEVVELGLVPLGEDDFPPVSGEVQGTRYYTGRPELRQKLSPGPQAAKLAGTEQEFLLEYQLCDERGNCFLPSSLRFRLPVPEYVGTKRWEAAFSENKPPPTTEKRSPWFWPGILLLSLLGGMMLNLMPCIFPIFSLKLQRLLRYLPDAPNGRETAPPLPNSSGISAGRMYPKIRNSLLYTLLGIELSFVVPGLALSAIHSLRPPISAGQTGSGVLWGSQLQQPLPVYGILLLLFVMALSMLGIFHFRAPQLNLKRKSNVPKFWSRLWPKNNSSEALRDIGQGFLIVVIGTPCSAPLLGPIFGLLLLHSSVLISVVGLLVIGLGLWLPYALLAMALLRGSGGARFGRVVETLQQRMPFVESILGFVMLGAVLYFYLVLQHLVGVGQAARVLWSLLSVGWTAWLWGQLQSRRCSGKWTEYKGLTTAYVISLLFCLTFSVQSALSFVAEGKRDNAAGGKTVSGLEREASEGTVGAVPLLSVLSVSDSSGGSGDSVPLEFSSPTFLSYTGSAAERAALEKWRKKGYGVFIEYTAAWCVTCKLNQARLLHTARFRKWLGRQRILYLKADLTKPDSLLAAELNELGRASLPTYLLYLPGAEKKLLPTFPGYGDFTATSE